MTQRYAIYFTPAHGSPWWSWGAHWLGRDECFDQPLPQPVLPRIAPTDLHAWTEYPRRYGFHATLKAPFALAQGHTVDQLQERMRALAKTLHPVTLGRMRAVHMDDFVAVVPEAPPDALAALGAACVTYLDDLRAPMSPADWARRQPERLDPRAQELLRTYGYPLVLERFRLHFTLASPVTEPVAQSVIEAVQSTIARLNHSTPLVLDRLCLFVEPGPGMAFQRMADMELLA